MNPHISSETNNEDSLLADPTTHRSYTSILKMVLWDEPQEKIDQKIRVNKIPPIIAEQLYQHARKDRIQTIKKEYAKQIFIGLLIILFSSGAFLWTIFLTLGSRDRIIFIWFAPLAWGVFKLMTGIIAYLTASQKTGSVADEI